MNTDLMFSSETDEWATPQDFFDKLDEVFNFDLDVCCLPSSAKCEKYYTPETDGLSQDWHKEGRNVWMNPPYGREIGLWMEKAFHEGEMGATVVCLVPTRTDTKWWHSYAIHGEISYVKGRLKFGEASNSAPFPSAVIVFRPRLEKYI